jgi:hypothetical protein
MILPTGSDLQANPPTDCHLCFSFSSPSERGPLSLCQGVVFDTPHKNTLQEDYWRL